MKINIGKFIGQIFSGQSPVDAVLTDINAELDRVERTVIERAKGGEDLAKILDDAFGAIKTLIDVNVKKAVK